VVLSPLTPGPGDVALADPPTPSSITLVGDSATFAAGESVHLTATTDVTVTGTGQTIRIFDDTTSTELESCSSSFECVVDVQFFTGGAHTYIATVGSLESDPVEVSRALWSVDLAADVEALAAAETAELTATANQGLGETDGQYELFVFNQTTEELLVSCDTGDTCVEESPTFYLDDAPAYTFIAVVGATGSPETIDDVDDVQATSDPVTVSRTPIEIEIETDKTDLTAGDTVTVTVTADQGVELTNDLYAIHIFEAVSGELIKTCTTGTVCETDYYWDGGGWGVVFVAYIDSTPSPTGIGDIDGESIMWGAYAPLNIDAWDVELSTDKTVLAAGESNTLTVVTDQDLSNAGGDLAVYIVDWTTGIIVGSCTTGTTCVVTDHFYKSTDWAYASHNYMAYVAESGATDPDELGVSYNMYGWSSGSVHVTSLPWTADIDLTGGSGDHFQFTVQLNQSPGQTGGQLAFYLYNLETLEYEGQCAVTKRCVITTQHSSDSGYLGFVTERVTPHTDMSEAWNVWATAELSWSALVDGRPIFGPVLRGEAVGGSNPAEKGCQCAHADPVNTATGEYFENVSDIGLRGIGPALSVDRSYSTANATIEGPFGFGWSASLDARIEELIPGDVTNPLPIQVQVVQENGSTTLFTRDESSDEYVALGRVQAELSFDEGADTWTYVRALIETLTFDASGRLTAQQDLNGNQVTVARDGNGKITSLEAAGDRELLITWTGDRITQVTDSAARTVSYAYDTNGDLVTVTAVDGAVTTYAYDSAHRILTVTKPGGGVVTNAYDSEGRVTSQTDPIGRETTFAYAEEPWNYAQITTIIAPDGSQTVEEYVHGAMVSQTRAAGTAYEATTLNTYDADLNLVSTTDPAGALTSFTYNGDGRTLTLTDALDHTTTFTYDALGNVTSVIDPLGRETVYTYDADGNRLSEHLPSGAQQIWTFNSNGTVATHEDALGNETVYTYSPAGLVVSVEDPTGRVTETTYNDAGSVVSTIDPAGKVTEYTVDEIGRVLTSTDPLERATTYAYDADGNMVAVVDPANAETVSTFDLAGQLTSTTDALLGVTTYAYTLGGRLETTTQPGSITSTNEYDGLGQLLESTDPLGRTTAYAYDQAGNITLVTYPSGVQVASEYNLLGLLVSATDANAEETIYAYDEAGQLISSTDPLMRETTTTYTLDGLVDTVTLPDNSEETYLYDDAGRLIEFLDADGFSTEYAYDDAGRAIETTRPGGLVTEWTYDTAGRVSSETRPDLTTLEYTYDDAGQLIEIDPSASGATTVQFDYDLVGNRVEIIDATGTSEYQYDLLERLVQETDGSGNSVGYAWDALGRLTELTYPSTAAVTYTYDAAGEMTSLTDWNANQFDFEWTLDGELAERMDPNGVTYTLEYSDAGDITSIEARNGAGLMMGISYAYDAARQIVAREFSGSHVPASSTSYEYDELGQIAGTSLASDYQSTPAGSLLQLANESTLSYGTDQRVDELNPISGPSTTYDYDANGARESSSTGATTTDYVYDAFGSLSTVDSGTAIDFTSDATGLRRTRTEGLDYREFSWSTAGSLALLLDDDEHEYVYGPGTSPVAQVTTSGDLESLYQDAVGSIVLLVDENATSSGYYSYSEYGSVDAHGGTIASEVLYTGNWYDTASELLYLRARDYDPETGQFISVDPAIDKTHQPYAYANNNPLIATDPTGLCAWISLTYKDALCNYYYYTGLGDSIATQWAYFEDGAEHGSTFNVGMLWDPEYDKNWDQPSYWAGDVAGVLGSCGFLLTMGMGGGKGEPELPGLNPVATAPKTSTLQETGIHGNSADSPVPATVYELRLQTGEYLKTGISQNPFQRYTQSYMANKQMTEIKTGPRREMLELERDIVSRNPGPLNFEPWAGSAGGGGGR
jgi:RHS repeat-associated protein